MKSKPQGPITTVRLPQICPACTFPSLDWLRESGGVTRLTCARCAWTERYLQVEKMPEKARR